MNAWAGVNQNCSIEVNRTMLFKEDENQCSVLHKQVLVNIPNILLKLCMPVKLHFSPLIQEHKWNGSMALNNSVLVTWRQHLAEGGLLQTCSVGSKILLLFHWQNWFIFSYQMDLGKMDEFCNGDGMPYFMSVSLPFCMLLFLGFSRILKKGTLSLKKKIPIFKSLFRLLQGTFQSACL